MKSLLIIGAGSFSPEVDELARLLGYDEIAFLDDHPEKVYSQPVIGNTSSIEYFRKKYDAAIVALGNNENRIRLHAELKRFGYEIPALIHPTAYVSPDAVIGEGCIIRAKAVVSRYVQLGEACILNVGALIDHHVTIGDGCHIFMGAVVRGLVKVPPLTVVPSNSILE